MSALSNLIGVGRVKPGEIQPNQWAQRVFPARYQAITHHFKHDSSLVWQRVFLQ